MRLKIGRDVGGAITATNKVWVCLKCGARTWWSYDACLKHSDMDDHGKEFYYEAMSGIEAGVYYICA